MAKKIRITRKDIRQEDEFIHWSKELLAWVTDHSLWIGGGIAAIVGVVIIFAIVSFFVASGGRNAQAALSKAEAAFMAPVIPKEQLDKNPRIREVFGDVFVSDADRLEASLTRFQEVASKYEDSPQGNLAQYYEALVLQRLDRCEDAKPRFSDFAAKTDQAMFRSLAWQAIGSCEEKGGNSDAALDAFRKASEAAGEPALKREAQLSLARVHEARKDFASAVQDLEDYLKSAGQTEDAKEIELKIASLKKLAGS